MIRRGEISQAQLRRQCPHHVAVSAQKVRAPANSEAVRGFAETLSVARRTCALRPDDLDDVVFCFAGPPDAAVAGQEVRPLDNRDAGRGFGETLWGAGRAGPLPRDDPGVVVFFFAARGDASVFCKLLGGESLGGGARR